MMQEALRLSHVEIVDEGHVLFSDLSMCLYEGEILCLPCLSAAQRDALCRVLWGKLQLARGWIFMGGEPQRIASPVDAMERGMFCILKDSALFYNLSIVENLFALPLHAHRLLLRRKKMLESCRTLLRTLLPEISPSTPIAQLSSLQRHLLELVKAVRAEASVIVYDHDLSMYSEAEFTRLTVFFRALTARGIAVLCMSANLGRAMKLANRIAVVREKNMLMVFAPPYHEAQLKLCLLGFSPDADIVATPAACGDTLLEVRRMQLPSLPYMFDLSVHVGELVGIIDMTHCIEEELFNALAGCGSHTEQRLQLCGKPAALHTQEESFNRGVLLVQDLATDSLLFPTLTVEQNIRFPALRRSSGIFCRIRNRFLSVEVRQTAQALGIEEATLRSALTSGSVFETHLARIRLTYSRLLLLHHPFSGLHVAEQDILRRFLTQYAAEGNGVLLAAADARDLSGLCTRIYVITPTELRLCNADGLQNGGLSDAQNL